MTPLPSIPAFSASAPPPSCDVVEVEQTVDLARIFEPDVLLCHLPRARDAAIDAYLEIAAPYLGEGLRQVTTPAAGLPEDFLPDLPGRDALLRDVAFLTTLYCDLLGCERAALRLEVLRRAMCPRFHVDRTGIRLLCAWRGGGTEWLREACADRGKLGHGANGVEDARSGLILDVAGIGRVAPHAIALLKGELWQGAAPRGVIHRSPPVSPLESPRVLLALDAIWD